MTYFRRPLSGLGALGGVESCGPSQVWDPNIEFMGQKGQCMPRANYTAAQLVNPNAYPGVVKSSTSSAGSKVAEGFATFFKALTPGPVAPGPTVIVQQQPSGGMSTTTKLALAGGAAILLIALVASRE